MKTLGWMFAIAAIILTGCKDTSGIGPATMGWPLMQTGQDEKQAAKLSRFYEPVEVAVEAGIPEMPLPAVKEKIANWDKLEQLFANSNSYLNGGETLLLHNGFVVLEDRQFDQAGEFYEFYQQRGLPVLITSDVLLHLYHVQFDTTLKDTEENCLYKDMVRISRRVLEKAQALCGQTDGEQKAACQLLMAYAAVGLKLLGEDVATPAEVKDDVEKELTLIEGHEGFAVSPLFGYKEDYSQYVPRGHYTQSDLLKQYFKGLMWYGRMTFLLRGKTAEVEGLIPLAQARVQTKAACLLAGMMQEKLEDGKKVGDLWQRVYAVTAFYVGLADDLTPLDYQDAIRKAAGNYLQIATLENEKAFQAILKELALKPKPRIYGGTGDIPGPPVTIADEKTLLEALGLTQGARLMGQRFVPDSYMMGKLVYPTIGAYQGQAEAFTMAGNLRAFPRGLDVMAVLCGTRARHWLKELHDDAYAKYEETLTALQHEYAELPQETWRQNMYWAWLDVLKELQSEVPGGYPTFMRGSAWADKQLAAALASWAQLRHDTILYAKQSYTMRATAIRPQGETVPGYVEPVPGFYAKLLALTQMSRKGLQAFDVLSEEQRECLEGLEDLLTRLLAISKKELQNETLSDEDYGLIRGFAKRLETLVGSEEQMSKTTLVADVHTDANSGLVLEEATGFLHPLIAVYLLPDGSLQAGVGAALSHYEFKHPMQDRLTDEAWRNMLHGEHKPDLPEWTETFTAGAEHK